MSHRTKNARCRECGVRYPEERRVTWGFLCARCGKRLLKAAASRPLMVRELAFDANGYLKPIGRFHEV